MNDDEILRKYEAEILQAPIVYGDADNIADALNALMHTAGVFGQDVFNAMVDAVNTAVPLLAAMDARKDEPVADLYRDYYDTEEKRAVAVDAMADGVTAAQEWLQRWMNAHDLPVIRVLLPDLEGEVRPFTFGRLSDIRAQFPHFRDGQIRLAASGPIIEDDE